LNSFQKLQESFYSKSKICCFLISQYFKELILLLALIS
jgi:hypothetical protein